MISDNIIRKLAKHTLKPDGTLDKKVAEYVVSNLSRRNLAKFLRSFKSIISKNFVTVYYDDIIPEGIRHEIESKFNGKEFLYKKSENALNGIRIETNDTVTDLSFKGSVNETLDNLKN